MTPRFYAARYALAIFLGLSVAGCAGTNVTPASSVANPASQSVASGSASAAQVRGDVKPDKASYERALYVANYNPNTGEDDSVLIFTNTNLAFVTDAATGNVTVINYQSGANTAVLGGSYGIKYPSAVVDGPNAVY